MPRYRFLGYNQELNKDNFREVLNDLYNESKKLPDNEHGQIKKYFDEIDIKSADAKLNYFINITKGFLNQEQINAFINVAGINQNNLRTRIITYYKNVLSNNYIEQNQEVNDLVNFLNNPNQNANVSLEEIAQRVRPLVKEEYRDKINTNVINYISLNDIKNHFGEYLNYLENNLNNDQLKTIGENTNNYKSIYDYSIEDDLSRPIYDNETTEIINSLKQVKSLDNKELSDEEIAEYEDALNYANKLFGKPLMDINDLIGEKTELDRAIASDYSKNMNERLEEMGYDPNTVFMEDDANLGTVIKVHDDKKTDLNTIRNFTEFENTRSSNTHIKEILYKMQDLGFDKGLVTGEEANKVYGLRLLYNAGNKYKEAIKSNDPNERLKAAIYAKEIKEIDSKIKEVLNMIKEYMPLNIENNFAIPGNVDSIRNDDIPAEYRLDYAAISHLAALNNILNLIKVNNWEIDEFVDRPLNHIRDLYDTKFNDNVNPIRGNNELTGVDLLFNMSRNTINSEIDNLDFAATRALEGMALFDDNENIRKKNYSKYKSFMNIVNNPYVKMRVLREKIAKNPKIDSLLINPNLKIKDLGIKYYDAKNL